MPEKMGKNKAKNKKGKDDVWEGGMRSHDRTWTKSTAPLFSDFLVSNPCLILSDGFVFVDAEASLPSAPRVKLVEGENVGEQHAELVEPTHRVWRNSHLAA
jgi:hypothetical protein